MKVLLPLAFALFVSLFGVVGDNNAWAQAPDAALLAELEAAIESKEVIKIETVTRLAAEINFIGPIQDDVARGIISLPSPLRDISHIKLQVVQPGGAIAHKATLDNQGRWGRVFKDYKFGLELENVGIQAGAILVMDLYKGGQEVAHAEAELPEQSVRPDYVVEDFIVEALDDTLKLTYTFTNSALQGVTVVPQVTLTNQNIEQDSVLLQKYLDAVQVSAKSEVVFEHQVDLPAEPGVYEAVVWLFDKKKNLVTGALRQAFVVEGDFGVFRSVRLHQDAASGEDRLLVKGVVSPSVSGGLQLRVVAEPKVAGVIGGALLDKVLEVEVTEGQRFEAALPLDLTVAHNGELLGQVQLLRSDRVIAETDFTFLVTRTDVTPTLPVGQTPPSLIPFVPGADKDTLTRWGKVGGAGLLLLLVIYLFWRWRKHRSKILMGLGFLLLGSTAYAQTLVNTWYYPQEDWVYNPLATAEFENFRYTRFDGNVFNPLTQEGFFQVDPEAIMIRFVNGADYRYSQAFTFTVSDKKKYQLDIPVPTDLSEAPWALEIYFKYGGSWYISAWEDEITTDDYFISVDKTEPVLQQFTYDGQIYDPSEQLLQPGLEVVEDEETVLLQSRKAHFLDIKANQIQRDGQRHLRKQKIHQRNHIITLLAQEEFAQVNEDAGATGNADPAVLVAQLNVLTGVINNITKILGETVAGGDLFGTGHLTNEGSLDPIDTTPTVNTIFTCAKDVGSTNSDVLQTTHSDCVGHFQTQIGLLNPQVSAKRSEIRTAKTRFKKAAIGVEFVCEDNGAGCNPTCNIADESCDVSCTQYPLSCSQYQIDSPAAYAANCTGTPEICSVDCTADPDICRMRGLIADVRGNFCDDDIFCDDGATRKFQACDNVGNCVGLSNESVATDWYDPVQPNLATLSITRNKNNVGGTETALALETTTGGVIVTNCDTLPSGFAGGDGSSGAPYQICNLAQLDNIRNGLNDYYVLTSNIDASVTTTWNSGAGWVPVNNFSGTLDGDGFVIKDLFINRPTADFVGLFQSVIGNADIIDVAVVDVTITGQDRVGALVGNWSGATSGGLISNAYSSGTVTGRAQVGGLIGRFTSSGGFLTNSHSSATVIGSSTRVGGLLGYFIDNVGNDAGNIKRVYATGTVTGTTRVGGVIGSAVINTLDTHVLQDAYATGDVTGTDLVGGVIGETTITAGSPIVESVYATGQLTSGASVAGITNTTVGINDSYFLETDSVNVGVIADGGAGAALTNVYSFAPLLMKAQSTSSNATQPYYGWDSNEWNFGTVNDFPALLDSVSYNETIAGNSGALAATDRFSFAINATDPVNPDASSHPALFDTSACGSSSATGFFLADQGDDSCSQRYTACALSSTLRGVKDNLLGTACGVACPTVTYDIDGQTVTETYERQGDLCVPRCDYRLFDGCFPFLLIGETCENVSWLPPETSIDEGTVFTQTSNCGDTRDWVGTKPITQSIKHFLDGKNVFGVYFYDTFEDASGFTDMAYRGQFTVDTEGFTQLNSGSAVATWVHEAGYSPNGGKVLKIESTSLSGGYAGWERTGISVSANTDYILTYWIKTNATTNRNGSGAWPAIYQNGVTALHPQYAATMKSVDGDLTWQKVEIPFTTGAGATTIDVQMRLEVQNDKLAYFDDVVVMEENWRFDSTKSWYTETKGDAGDGICDYITGDGDGDPRLGTDVRCGEDYFPEKSVIAFTSDGIWLLDAVAGVMWMSALEDPFGGWRYVFSTLLSGEPFASNGKLMAAFRFDQGGGRNGAVTIGDFISDTMYSHRMSNCFTLSGYKGTGSGSSTTGCTWGTQNAYNWSGFVNDPLTSRNINRNPWTTVMPPSISLGNHQINAMHSNIVSGKEYVVVAHDFAGITILNKTDDTVQYVEFDGDDHNDPGYPEWDDLPGTANDYRDVYLADDGRLYYIWDYYNDTKTRLHVIDDITSLPFNGSVLSGGSSYDQRIQPNSASSSYPTTALNQSAAALDVKDERILIGGDTGFDLFRGLINGGSQHPDLAKQRVSRSYASAPLFGDVLGHWATSIQDVSGKANDLSNTNGVNISVVNVGSDLQKFNFNDSAYLRSDPGDFSVGSEITFGAWVFTDGSTDDGGYVIAQKDVVDTEYAIYRTADNKIRVEGVANHTIDSYTLDGWNFVVASFDGTTKRAYIDGVKVLEVADTIGTASGGTALDPSNITYLDEFDDNSGSNSIDAATSVEVVGNYAYVTARNGDALQIFNISDPANIVYVGGYRDTTRLDRAYDVAISGNYAYVVAQRRDSMVVIDISNPANPTFVAEERDGGGGNFNGAIGIDIQGNYAYIANNADDSLGVVDISNPLDPNWVGEYDSSSNMDNPYDVKVVGNYAYLATTNSDALVIVDISNPSSPSYVGRYRNTTLLNGARAVEISGNYAFVACYDRRSMAVIDISNPANPTFVTEVRMTANLSGARGITIDGNYAFVTAYIDDSVQVIDISTPTSPTWVGEYKNSNSLNGAIDVEVVGDKIFTANYNDDSLTALDIGETVSALRMNIGAGEDGGNSTTLLNGALALPFVVAGTYSDQNVRKVYNGTRDWFAADVLITLQGVSDQIVDVKFGDYGSYFVATDGGGVTQFDYSGRVVRTISDAVTTSTNVQIVSNNINAMDYRNGWLIIAYQGRGVEIVNIAPQVSEMLSNYDDAEFDPFFFY